MVKYLSDALKLQSNLDKTVRWSEQNRLPLSINKCHFITFSCVLSPVLYYYSFGHTLLSKVTSIRDIGISLKSDLSFSLVIKVFTNKAFKMLGFHYRNTKKF